MANYRLSFCVLLLLVWSSGARACDDEDDDGLDVGLVLSGGGALATTHIGALTVIERLGVPIHCVVGTSMGSVVGALYAAGYDSAALRRIFQDSRWPEVFNGVTSRRDEPYLRKEQDDLYLSGYLAGLGEDGLRLPGGFRSMSGLKGLYRQLLVHVPLAQDFDELPTPYRAVAMDLSSGAPVALGSGDLVEAMLASMAVPGVFPPRVVDGRLLVDGGMAAQLPVAAAQALGADVIIALDTTVEPPPAQESWSVAQVSQQLIRIRVWENWLEQRALLGDRDVLIRPDLDGLTTSSFFRARQGFASGEVEAAAAEAALLRVKSLAAPAPARQAPPEVPPRPDTLVVDNRSVISESVVSRRLGFTSEVFTESQTLHHGLQDLAAFGSFGEVDLALLDEDTAQLQVTPLALGRNLLNFGVRASNNFEGDSTYALLGRLSRRPFNSAGSELRVSAELGTDLGLAVELYQPFGPESRFFLTPGIAYRGEELLLDLGEVRIGEFWQQSGEARLRLGRELADWGIVAVEGIVQTEKIEAEVAIVEVEDTTGTYGGYGVQFAVDTLNRSDWPSRGLQLQAGAQRLHDIAGSASDTDIFMIKAFKPLEVAGLNVQFRAEAQTVESEDDDPLELLRLGGFRRLSAFADNSVLSDRYAMGSVEVYRRLNPSEAIVSIPVYVGALFEYADTELRVFDLDLLGLGIEDQLYSVGAYLGTDTVLGPFFLGAAFGNDGRRSLFMHFGKSF